MSDALYDIFEQLQDAVTDERGFGGPVMHKAEVDGWTLRISTSDFGDLMVSARKEGGGIHAFERGPDEWWPITRDTSAERAEWLTGLAVRAPMWKDMLEGRGRDVDALNRKDGDGA